jgi:hypothetical protein
VDDVDVGGGSVRLYHMVADENDAYLSYRASAVETRL